MVMTTDEQYKNLVADGRIASEDLEGERAKNRSETEKIFKLASMVTYQLSTGLQRDLYVDAEDNLCSVFCELIAFDGDGVSW